MGGLRTRPYNALTGMIGERTGMGLHRKLPLLGIFRLLGPS